MRVNVNRSERGGRWARASGDLRIFAVSSTFSKLIKAHLYTVLRNIIYRIGIYYLTCLKY